MAALREREIGRIGYREHAGCKDDGAQDCGGVLQLSREDDSENLPEPSLPLQHGMY
jgi:hypothetical protein